MNRMQKMAWMTVICCGAGALLSGITVSILYFTGRSSVASAGLGLLGITGFAGIGAFIFKKDPGAVSFDERDHQINLKAVRVGFGLAFSIIFVVSMGVYEYCRFQSIKMISIEVLPILIWPPFVAIFLGHAATILILYGKDNKAAKGGPA